MLRGLFLALVAAAAVATDITSYEPGNDYVYRYEVITTSALRAANHQAAGLKITTNVRMQITDQKVVTLKLESPELCKVNQEVPAAETVETVFEHSCTPLTGPEADAITTQLVKPFTFKWEFGIPTEFRADTEEMFWSVNIKRGLVNLLNLNLKEQDTMETLSPELRGSLLSNSNIPVGQFNAIFRAFEADMVGECETIYAVNEDENTDSTFFVNKVRNYDNCKTTPMFRKGLMANFADVYPEVEEATAIKTLSHADYMLQGNRLQYLVKSAYLTHHFSLRPFENVESAYTCTRQHLTLFTTTPTVAEITLPTHMETLPPLTFEVPLEMTTSSPVHERPFTPEAIEFSVNTVETLLEEIVSTTPEEIDETISTKILRVARTLEELPIAQLKKVVNKLACSCPCPCDKCTCETCACERDQAALKKREIILDILPTLTRTDIIPVIAELLQKDIISTPRTVIMLNLAALTVTPSPRMFEDLMVLAQEQLVTESPLLKKSVLLTAGVVANKIRTMYTEMNVDAAITIPEMHKITEHFSTLLDTATTDAEKTEIMAVFGNAGLLELFPKTEEIITEPTTPDYLKSKAIYSLRKIASTIPEKVQSLLLPMFVDAWSDATHTPHCRIACFLMTMETHPSAGVVQLLTHALKRESNIEVLSFVTSYLETMATSEDPKMLEMTTTIKTALEGIHLVSGGFVNSGVYSFEKYIKSAGPLGADIRLSLFNAGVTPTPDSAILHFATSLFGKKFDVAQMGIITSGLKDVFWNIYGPENRLTDFFEGRATFEDVLRPFTELASKILSGVETITNKFTTTERNMISERMVQLYTKLFDYELFSMQFKDEELVDIFNTIKDYIPEIITTLRSEYPVAFTKTVAAPDALIMLPTPAGIPVSVRLSTVAQIHINGKVQLEGTDGLTTLLSFFSGSIAPVTLKTEFNPSFVASAFICLGTQLPFMKAGAIARLDVVSKFAAKTEFTVIPTEKKVKFTIEPPTVDTTVARVKLTPLTMFALTPTTNEPVYEVITVRSVPTIEIATPVFGKRLGLPMQILAEVPSMFTLLRPETFLVAPVWTEFKFLPTLETTERFEFEVKYFAPGEEPKVVTATQESHSWFSSASFRSSPRHHDVTGLTFDSITPERDIEETTARHVMVTVRSVVRDTTEKEIKMKLTHMFDMSYLKHQFNFQLVSSPLLTHATMPMKAVFNTVVFVPEFFTKFVPSTPVFTEPELLSTAEVKFGFTDTTKRLAFVKLFWKRELNPTTTPTVSDMLDSPSPFTFAKHIPVMFRNVSALQGIVNATLLNKMFHEIPTNMPLVLTTEVEYTPEHVPEMVKWTLPTFKELALKCQCLFGEKAMVMTLPAWNTARKIKFTTIFDPFLEETKLILELPTQTTTVYGLPLPMPFIFKKMIHTPAWPLITSQLMEGDITAGWCSVTPNNYIHTFDMLSTKLPAHQCEMVLAKDCSHLNIFLVTMKPTENGRKMITMYLPGYTVEVIPTTTSVTVKINGEVTVLTHDNTPFIINDPTTGTEILRLLSKSSTVLITSWKYGLTVETDCVSAFVKPSDLYRGQLCGACSDFIASLYNELRGPHMELYSTPEEFLSSYTIPSAGCETPLTSTTCTPVERNVVFERFVKGVQSICVSMVPINQCSGTCIPRDPRQLEHAFHCMPTHLPSARRLREEAETGPLTLTAVSADHHEIITEFQTCAPAL